MEFWEREYEKAIKGEKEDINDRWKEYAEACWQEMQGETNSSKRSTSKAKPQKKKSQRKASFGEKFTSGILKLCIVLGILAFFIGGGSSLRSASNVSDTAYSSDNSYVATPLFQDTYKDGLQCRYMVKVLHTIIEEGVSYLNDFNSGKDNVAEWTSWIEEQRTLLDNIVVYQGYIGLIEEHKQFLDESINYMSNPTMEQWNLLYDSYSILGEDIYKSLSANGVRVDKDESGHYVYWTYSY